MSFKGWLSVVTFSLIAIILFFARHDILHAWHLLGQVNLWILALIIPILLIDYFAAGQMVFSYLHSKDKKTKIPIWTRIRLSLELNFVNHVLPSGGVSGISYMNWRLGKFGVPASRASMAQAVRYAMGFLAIIVLLCIAVIVVTIDGSVNRWVILMSSALVSVMIGAIFLGVYLVGSRRRMIRAAEVTADIVNRSVRKLTFNRRQQVVSADQLQQVLLEMHDDYLELRRNRTILLKPFLWAIVFTLAELATFLVTFWALGQPVNPAPVFIAYCVATVVGLLVVTPGGAGAYEALMVFFLALAGLNQGLALAGILLTRMLVLITTIGLGYIFYQRALLKYGSDDKSEM